MAIGSAVRTRNLDVASGGTTWASDVEIVPGIALQLGSPNLTLSVGYAPRLTIPLAVADPELAILNRAAIQATWQFDPLWSIAVAGRFVVGDYSQLVPASTPGGGGPPPATLDPVRSFQVYPYVDIDTMIRLEVTPSPVSRIWVEGGYFDRGGTGPVGEANQPRSWGPKGTAGFSFDSSRTTRWTTSAYGQNWTLSNPTESFGIATVTQAWTERWTSELDTTVAGGVGVANRNVETATAAGHVVPVARASLGFRAESRHPLTVAFDVALAPYYDTYVRIPYQRLTGGLTLGWQPSDAWLVSASLAAAYTPYNLKDPESYGTGGIGASFAPVRFLILSGGGFTQVQFQGQSASASAGFTQWTMYLAVALREQLSL